MIFQNPLLLNPVIYSFYLEAFVSVLFLFIFIAIYLKYIEKGRNSMTLKLLYINLCFFVSVISSLITKYILSFHPEIYQNFIDNSYLTTNPLLDWILGLLFSFRIPMILSGIAAYLSYNLKNDAFNKLANNKVRIILWIYCMFNLVFDLIFYRGEPADRKWETSVAFALVFFYMLVIYGSFFLEARKMSASVDVPRMKSAFNSLATMSISYILAFFFFLIEQLLTLSLGESVADNSIFLFSAWIATLIANFSTYFGYINPRKSKKD